MRKFDLIVANPPFSIKGSSSKQNVWTKILENVLEHSKSRGTVVMLHPSVWRGGGSFQKDIWNLLAKQVQMHYLFMHSIDEGKKVFNASVAFDCTVLENTKQYTDTLVRDVDGVETVLTLKERGFLPSGMIEEVDSLIGVDNE